MFGEIHSKFLLQVFQVLSVKLYISVLLFYKQYNVRVTPA